MRLLNAFRQRFRPSQHSLPRFMLWAILYTGAVLFLFLQPQLSFTWLMLMSLGAIAGGPPASPDRAAKPGAFIAAIALAAALVIALGLALWWPSPDTSFSTEAPQCGSGSLRP